MATAKQPTHRPQAGAFARPRICLVPSTQLVLARPKRRVRGEWRVATPGDLVEGFRRGTVRTAALIGAQSASGLPVIEAAIVSAGAAYRDRDGFAVPLVAILAFGVRG